MKLSSFEAGPARLRPDRRRETPHHRKAGLPYIDPDTGEPVAGTRPPAGAVEEPPNPPPASPPSAH